ncbi:MAG TPA: hypothetical protein VGQ08_03790 [Nitrospiraceae bacterium]|jgi:hypothetical protein|nr:hypothetical protein [Nitrospiraceae bacterium]
MKKFENIIPDELKGWFGGVYGRCAHDCPVATRRWYAAQGISKSGSMNL